MHRLDDGILVNTALLRRFEAEAGHEGGDGRHQALIMLRDGRFLSHGVGPDLDGTQTLFAQTMLRMLNKELHHDGAWVIVYTHPRPDDAFQVEHVLQAAPWQYGRFVFLWLDADGDVQFPYEWSQNEGEFVDFADCMIAGPEYWTGQAESAWQMWHELMIEVIDHGEGQTYKRAMGEAPPSWKH